MENPTLILSSRFTEDSRRLWQAAVQRGWQVVRLQGLAVPDSLRKAAEPILYLEALSAPVIAEVLGVTLVEPALDWLPMLPERYRQRNIRLMSLGEARAEALPAFIKPPNDKSFPAQVYDSDTLPTDFPDNTPVLVSEVVRWELEYRCFVSDRTLRTFSLYLRNGELQHESGFLTTPAEDRELFRFVHLLLADTEIELPPAVVLDVGVIEGRGWAVVEANAAWGAGIYGCDPSAALDVLRVATVKHSPFI